MLPGYYEITTKETEMRPVDGWPRPHRPNTDKRHKTYTIEQMRTIKLIRARRGKEGLLCPPLPCPYKICAVCDSARAYWDKALADELPKTLTLL